MAARIYLVGPANGWPEETLLVAGAEVDWPSRRIDGRRIRWARPVRSWAGIVQLAELEWGEYPTVATAVRDIQMSTRPPSREDAEEQVLLASLGAATIAQYEAIETCLLLHVPLPPDGWPTRVPGRLSPERRDAYHALAHGIRYLASRHARDASDDAREYIAGLAMLVMRRAWRRIEADAAERLEEQGRRERAAWRAYETAPK